MLYNEYFEEDILGEDINRAAKTKNRILSSKTIIFVILSMILSVQTLTGGLNPFGYVMMGLASIFNVPLLAVFISSLVGISITSFSISSMISLTLFFILFTFLTVVVNIEGVNKKYNVMIKLLLSVGVIKIINLLFIKDLSVIFSIYEILLVAILYVVFLSGIFVILNYKKGYIFSEEENIAMLCLLAFILTSLKGVTILDISLMNVLGISIALVYGWKNGPAFGGISGLVMGLVISAVSVANVTYIVTLAFSSMLAGLLGKIGKVPLIFGFIVGSIIVNYLVGSSSYFTVTLIEILIASLPLFFLPKKLENELDIFFNNKALKSSYEHLLDYGSDIKNRLDAVSGVFSNLSDITLEMTKEDKIETREVIKRYIKDYTQNNCLGCSEKNGCLNMEEIKISVDYISLKLENDEEINESMLNINCKESAKIIKDIEEIYKAMKLMRILKKKEAENSKRLSNQYKEVSKIISNLSKNIKDAPVKTKRNVKDIRDDLKLRGYMIYEDELKANEDRVEYTFITDIITNIDYQKKEIIEIVSNILEKPMNIKLLLNISKSERSKIKLVSLPKYNLETGITAGNKAGETISGDSYLSMELDYGRHLIAISDGAGSGAEAGRSSRAVINMLEKLLSSGFNQDIAIETINTIIKMQQEENRFASLDIAVINLETKESEYIKFGAAPTYIIQDNKISTLTSCKVPVGLLAENEYIPVSKKLTEGDIIIQISDGVVNDNIDKKNNYFTDILLNIDCLKSSKEIANELYRQILNENKNILNDDVTVIVNKLIKNY